ncbi:MAG: rhomboid family intramembrane serine protease [Deltaproteobacteria bacterium]|nr:rhomboid family intramembrane serine protease [Deltaproteobacteria bacterium]
MIPLRDRNPSGSFPVVTLLIIVANMVLFIYELGMGYRLERFLMTWGLVPLKVRYFFAVQEIGMADVFLPFFTSMFLHGGWLHVIGNMWYLWIFGDNVEDRLGHARYFLFYIICGLGAALTHVLFNINSGMPVVGASGAVAGVLGAYMFSFPKARVLTLVFIFIFITTIEIPAYFFLAFWFILQFLSGTMSIAASSGDAGGVAWWAHVGGFVLGILLITRMRRHRQSRQQRYVVRFDD